MRYFAAAASLRVWEKKSHWERKELDFMKIFIRAASYFRSPVFPSLTIALYRIIACVRVI